MEFLEISREVPQGPDLRLQVLVQDRPITILAQYKESGQPRIARQAVYQIKDWLARGLGAYGIFMAPYISPESAAICREAGLGYLDLSGNCLLSFETIYVRREGSRKPAIRRRELRSLYSPKAERVLRVLLAKPGSGWKTASLAEAAGVSFGQVANVKKFLADREWLASGKGGLRLKDPGTVLDEWARQYRFDRNRVADYYAMTSVSESEYQLAETCRRRNVRYALTAFSAAARLAPAVRYQRVAAYLDDDPDSLAALLGWKRVSSGANVSLLVPYDEGVFFDRRETDKVDFVTPVQAYLDLQSARGRGEEAAQALRKGIEASW